MNTQNNTVFTLQTLDIMMVDSDPQAIFNEASLRKSGFCKLCGFDNCDTALNYALQINGIKSFASYETAKEKYIALPSAGNYCIRTSPEPDLPHNANPVVSLNQTTVAPYADRGIFGISAINGFGTARNLGDVLNVMLAHEPFHLVYPCATWFPDFESALSWAWKEYSTRFFMRYNARAFYPLTPNEQLCPGDIFTDENFAYREKHRQNDDVQMTLLQYGLLH